MNMQASNYGNLDDAIVESREAVTLMKFTEDYYNKPVLRNLAADDPHAALAQYQIYFPHETELRIVPNTEETFNLVMPPDPNVALSDEALTMVAGGKSASTAGTAGTASTLFSCVSSASTIGSAGSQS